MSSGPARGLGSPRDQSRPMLTLHRRIVRGALLRRGTAGDYHALAAGDGEPHLVREDLLPGSAARWLPGGPRRLLVCVAHVTDLQLADVQSPVRFEFFNREDDDPRFAELVPMQRPQEALTPHAVLSMIETLNRITASPATGGPVDLAVTTGDAIDNAQWNELQAFLSLFHGGDVRLRSGGDHYEGVQSRQWPGTVFWRPDGDGPEGPDLFRSSLAFPRAPGLLERALDPLWSPGLALPWLTCYGNHEALVQGVGVVTDDVAAALVGAAKPSALPEGLDLDQALETFIGGAQAFLSGCGHEVTPDPDRRPVTRRGFVRAHLLARARPAGHGLTAENLRLGTAYFVHDLPGVRFIGLDTTRVTGASHGAVDTDQMWWLQARLAEVHSRYRAADGTILTTETDDKLVVVFSHHGTDTLTNLRGVQPEGGAASEGADLVGGPELLELLHRFPNVVLWLNGHTHTNAVRPRINPRDPRRGLWEVTTSAIVDWPCQTRLVELIDLGAGVMAVACTMVDHDSPLGPLTPGGVLDGATLSARQLAALHRELAANLPDSGLGSRREGLITDRNVVLPLRAPFDLSRLP